jgi:hypothetical protein
LAEAQTDKKLADVMSDVRVEFIKVNTKLENLERSTAGIKATV